MAPGWTIESAKKKENANVDDEQATNKRRVSKFIKSRHPVEF